MIENEASKKTSNAELLSDITEIDRSVRGLKMMVDGYNLFIQDKDHSPARKMQLTVQRGNFIRLLDEGEKVLTWLKELANERCIL